MPAKQDDDNGPGPLPTKPRISLRKGQLLTVSIQSLAAGGEGVSRDCGMPIFVNRTAPGDAVEVRLFDVRKDFARAEVVSVLAPSPVRAEPPCKIFKICGGCQWQHIGYADQLEAKADIVRQAIKHIGRLDPQLVKPTIAAEQPLFYRNKVQFPVGVVPSTGRILAGYYKQNSHELVNIKHCPVQPEPLDRALGITKECLEREQLSAYDESTHTGLIRHIAQRYSFSGDQVLVTIIINAKSPLPTALEQKLKRVANSLMSSMPEVIGVCLNFNSSKGNRILGDVTHCLAGEQFILEKLRSHLPNAPEQLKKGLDFRLSSTSFFQVNSIQAEVLLDQVLLAVTGTTSDDGQELNIKVPYLIDAYAGVGTMASWLASVADRILAIEEMGSSVIDGKINLALNGLTNVEFVQSKVEVEAPKLVAAGITADVVVVDPPRKGIDPLGLEALVKLAAKRIVYVSCNPATLARDLRLLQDRGYVTRRIQPIDMFPQTFHIECVSVLELQKPESKMS
jgi:23S rRNA (uracil1939-C5)-methyltransferase